MAGSVLQNLTTNHELLGSNKQRKPPSEIFTENLPFKIPLDTIRNMLRTLLIPRNPIELQNNTKLKPLQKQGHRNITAHNHHLKQNQALSHQIARFPPQKQWHIDLTFLGGLASTQHQTGWFFRWTLETGCFLDSWTSANLPKNPPVVGPRLKQCSQC